jgi:uncharacterized hydrophobic protein (TIGR00271 family)
MRHVRLVLPPDLTEPVLRMLTAAPEVTNVWHLAGAARKPVGDLVSCDVAAEHTSTLVSRLKDLGLEGRGTIALEEIDAAISREADRADESAVGRSADAVVWEEVEERVEAGATLSVSFLLLMVVATLIAAIGIVLDSVVLVIGAMVVGPEFGPLAGISVALAAGQRRLALRSLAALAVGLAVGIAAAAVGVALLQATGLVPGGAEPVDRFFTEFVSRPNAYSAIVALLAGAAGMVAITGAKSGTLVGVLISVTTIPAAADIGVSIVFSNRQELVGAATQLAINLVCLQAAAIAVLVVERVALAGRARGPKRPRRPF